MGLKTCETCRHLRYDNGKFWCTKEIEQEQETIWTEDCDEYYFDESYPQKSKAKENEDEAKRSQPMQEN